MRSVDVSVDEFRVLQDYKRCGPHNSAHKTRCHRGPYMSDNAEHPLIWGSCGKQTFRISLEESGFVLWALKLMQAKSEALLLLSRNVDIEVVAELVERAVPTVTGWVRDWESCRLASIHTGHAGNLNASKLTAQQREEITAVMRGFRWRSGRSRNWRTGSTPA